MPFVRNVINVVEVSSRPLNKKTTSPVNEKINYAGMFSPISRLTSHHKCIHMCVYVCVSTTLPHRITALDLLYIFLIDNLT